MQENRTHSLSTQESLWVGLTLFSMFFGAGNLIIAPQIGFDATSLVVWAMAGFVFTAVGLPILAILSVARTGSIKSLTNRISSKFSVIYGVVIYLAIGPFLALPRTASTSFEMIKPLLPDYAGNYTSIIFSLLFFGVAFALALKPNKLTYVMGRCSGPALLVLILLLIVGCFFVTDSMHVVQPHKDFVQHPAVQGFIRGYQTMDVLAGVAFGITISANIQSFGVTDSKATGKQIAKSGIIAGSLLFLIYCGFAYVGKMVVGITGGVPYLNGAQIIGYAAQVEYGLVGSVLSATIFLIACLNVCIGLISSISMYFSKNFGRLTYTQWAIIFTGISVVLSNVGLTGIIEYSVPVLQAIYPVTICLVLMGCAQKHANSHILMWRMAIVVCFIISSLSAIQGGFFKDMHFLLEVLPLSNMNLEWVVPTLVAAILGFVIERIMPRTQPQ